MTRAPMWTDRELDTLREHYPRIGRRVADMLPGRTPKACEVEAHRIGVARTQYRGPRPLWRVPGVLEIGREIHRDGDVVVLEIPLRVTCRVDELEAVEDRVA